MASGLTSDVNGTSEAVLRDCAAALKRVASYHLPSTVDRRFLWLSENKESLATTQREELDALVEFAEERTIDKLQAQALLQRLAGHWPHLVSTLR